MKILLNEIQQSKLLEHTIEIIKFIKTINEKDEAVKSCFKMVQVPVRLSESIALNILKKHQLIEGCNDLSKFDFGKKRGSFDIEYGTNSIKIEVKATGTSKFQRFRPNSLKSDYVMWIDFYGLRENTIDSKYSVFLFRTHEIFNGDISTEKPKYITEIDKKYKILCSP